ncbi:MAG: TlpA family protein disulfide reductase, partial [Polyangiaceae bacterium]
MRGAAVVSLLLVAACGGAETTEPLYGVASEAPAASGPARRFTYVTLRGDRVSHKSYAGRMTVIALVATYDTASQAQARFVNQLVVHHTPRINALLLVLEPPHHRPLDEA